jgi:thiamine biosynthesis protein ThiS
MPIEIQLNGEPRQVDGALTLAELLRELKIENRYCAVERNCKVVPREEHGNCVLQPGDHIEIVTLVGGG